MSVFRKCPSCGHTWYARDAFLADPGIKIVGYQVNYDTLLAGTFIFSHPCGATLPLSVRNFNGLYEGPIFKERATDTEDCPGYCLYQDRLDACDSRCECAYVRNIIDIIKTWPKK
jgi:hypothetical protein